jgi:hypothetical protein
MLNIPLTLSKRILRVFGIRSILSVFTFLSAQTAIEEGSVGEHGYRTVFGAESQAAPESKGAALGQWQHGSREVTSMLARRSCGGLVGFFGTGCHVDSELRLSPIL